MSSSHKVSMWSCGTNNRKKSIGMKINASTKKWLVKRLKAGVNNSQFPEEGGGKKKRLSTTSNQFLLCSSFLFLYYLKCNLVEQRKLFYLVLFHCGQISLLCLQRLGCAAAWLDGFSGAIMNTFNRIFWNVFAAICLSSVLGFQRLPMPKTNKR